jgi:CheY-like chemotaxis protein
MRTRSAVGTANVEDTIRLVSESDHERSLGATDPSFGGSGPPTGGQEEFLAMLAHEVRNPLAPIANAVAVLNGISSNEPLLHWVHDVIRRQVGQLTRLVDELLDASRVTTGKVSLHRRPVSITRIVDQAIDAGRPFIDHRNQALTVALPAEPVYVDGDLTRLAQVIGNLLHNAARYTQEGGSIALTAAVQGESVVVRVTDNGNGISAAALPRIFDLFAHGSSSPNTSPGGLGIGLTIARSMAELHGGKLEARSDGIGCGSEFTLTLPMAQEIPPDAVRARHLADAAASQARYRITLIDDDADSNAALGMLLQRAGHEVTAALNGLAGLELVRQHRPDIVLCDIGLAGMDGYAVAARLREVPIEPRPTAIAITGYGQPEDRARALAAGFDHHLVKPVDPDMLLRLIAATGARASRST